MENNLKITPKITHMDVEFTSRMMLLAEKVMFVDNIIYYYVQRNGSITKPKSKEKIERLLLDEIIVACLVRDTIESYKIAEKDTVLAIQKNYNSIIWNLLFRFLAKPKETDLEFKKRCLNDLKSKKLYPINGALKTSFQKKMRIIFNSEFFYKLILKLRS